MPDGDKTKHPRLCLRSNVRTQGFSNALAKALAGAPRASLMTAKMEETLCHPTASMIVQRPVSASSLTLPDKSRNVMLAGILTTCEIEVPLVEEMNLRHQLC